MAYDGTSALSDKMYAVSRIFWNIRVVKGGEVPLTARGWRLAKNSSLLKAPGVNWKGPRKGPLVFAGSMGFLSSTLPCQADLPQGAKMAAAAPASLGPG